MKTPAAHKSLISVQFWCVRSVVMLLLVSVVLILVPAWAEVELQLHKYNTTDQPELVCNDGSPGGFYYRPGNLSDRWIFYLQGGTARCTFDYTLYLVISSIYFRSAYKDEAGGRLVLGLSLLSDEDPAILRYQAGPGVLPPLAHQQALPGRGAPHGGH